MKIKLFSIGKTDSDYIKQGVQDYEKRLIHYIPYESVVIPDLKNSKNLTEIQQKEKEGEIIKNYFKDSDFIILLDENGKEYSSLEFSKFIEKKTIEGIKNIAFVIGGPYGFSNEIYKRANTTISLSKMTFSHQMVRLIFVEQLYRAMTIIRGEPYHHQ